MLKKLPVIAKNIVSVTLGQLLSGLFWMGSIVLSARYLGATGFGDLSYILAYVNMFQFIADFGLASIFIREVSRDKTHLGQFLGNLKSLYWVFSFFSMMIIIFGIRWTTDHPDVHLAAYPAAIATIALFHAFSYATVFRVFEEMEINSAGLVLSRLVFLLLVLVAIKLGMGLIGILTSLALSSILLWGIFYIIVSKKYIRPKLSFDLPTCRFMLKEGLSTGGTIILRRTLWFIDTFMLKTFATSVAVGLFNSVFHIIQIFYLIPWTVAIPFLPVFSRLAKTDSKQLHRMLNTLLKFSWIGTLPLALWATFIGHNIIQSIYGTKFSVAAEGLKIIVWSLPFLFPTSFFFSFSWLSEDKGPILSVSRLPY